MTPTELFWKAIESSVYSLPHRVEWFDSSDRKISEIHDTFIIPSDVVIAIGGDIYERCQEIAEMRRCNFFKANDGSLVFKAR